jgi:hypothetical protein
MKKLFSVVALATVAFATVSEVQARYYEQCHWTYNRWGDSIRVCRTVYRPSPVSDAVIIGATAGAVAGAVASTCAPEVITSNLSTTDTVLADLASSEAFAGQETFKQIIAEISANPSAKEKIDGYFALVDVKTSEEVAHFIGARKSELEKYSAVLSKNTELPTHLANVVVDSLTASLKGSLR